MEQKSKHSGSLKYSLNSFFSKFYFGCLLLCGGGVSSSRNYSVNYRFISNGNRTFVQLPGTKYDSHKEENKSSVNMVLRIDTSRRTNDAEKFYTE